MPDRKEGEINVSIRRALGHKMVEIFHVSEEERGGGLRDVGVLEVAMVVDAAVEEEDKGDEGEEEEGGEHGDVVVGSLVLW